MKRLQIVAILLGSLVLCGLALLAIPKRQSAASESIHLNDLPGDTAQVQPGPATLIAAGDVASCEHLADRLTANLIDTIPGTVLVLGDAAYSSRGDPDPYVACYAPTWGRFKSRTRAVPGNHDNESFQVAKFYKYFGGDRTRGYFSFNLGSWHVIGLNSNIDITTGSQQLRWLEADLRANPSKCALAYMHHPRFSSGPHGSSEQLIPIWKVLELYGVDVVLAGHDHIYERFAPMTPDHRLDSARGIREFVAGTGGVSHYPLGPPIAGSEIRNSVTSGVLKVDLGDGKYSWKFIPVAGMTFTDSGETSCH